MSINPTITVIVYLEGGFHSHRGHTTDRWDSDFDILVTVDKSVAIDYMAKKILFNLNSKKGKYDITLLINGQDYEWRDWETAEQFAIRADLCQEIVNEARLNAEKAHTAYEEKKHKLAEEKAAQLARTAIRNEINALKRRLDQDNLDRDRARLVELETELGVNETL